MCDDHHIKKIYEQSGVNYFYDNLQLLLKELIKELYCLNPALAFRLRLEHIDRALFKFRQAYESGTIRNTRQYLKACIKSAVLETAFENLEHQ
jgi:hypothetical protein